MEHQQQAFTSLLAQHQGLVNRVCLLYAFGEEDRKDLFQEIVLQLWKAFPSFKGDAKWSTWMYRVALNTAISGLRKSDRKVPVTELDEEHFRIANEDDRKEEMYAQLSHALKRLPEVERALMMLYLDGNSYEEIAGIMGITVNNTRVKMMRIRDKINKLIHA